MHYQHIIMFEPLNTQSFPPRSLISGPYHRRRTTQDLQPLPGTSSRYTQLFKDSFNAPPTSQKLHLCVKRPNLATSTAIQRFLSPQNTLPSPATSSRIRTRQQKQYSAHLQMNAVLQSDRHPACRREIQYADSVGIGSRGHLKVSR